VYKIFSNKCRFQRYKSQPSRFKKTSAGGHQKTVSPKSRYFTAIGQYSVKTVADRHGYAAYHNKP